MPARSRSRSRHKTATAWCLLHWHSIFIMSSSKPIFDEAPARPRFSNLTFTCRSHLDVAPKAHGQHVIGSTPRASQSANISSHDKPNFSNKLSSRILSMRVTPRMKIALTAVGCLVPRTQRLPLQLLPNLIAPTE